MKTSSPDRSSWVGGITPKDRVKGKGVSIKITHLDVYLNHELHKKNGILGHPTPSTSEDPNWAIP